MVGDLESSHTQAEEGSTSRSPAYVRHNRQLQNPDVGEFYCIVLNLTGCVWRSEIPLLADNISKRACRIRRKSQNKLLRARGLPFFEGQPDTSYALGLIEMQTDCLSPWCSGPPAPFVSGQQRRFDWKFLVFGRHLDDGQILEV